MLEFHFQVSKFRNLASGYGTNNRWSEKNGGPGGPAEFEQNQQLNPVWDEDPTL